MANTKEDVGAKCEHFDGGAQALSERRVMDVDKLAVQRVGAHHEARLNALQALRCARERLWPHLDEQDEENAKAINEYQEQIIFWRERKNWEVIEILEKKLEALKKPTPDRSATIAKSLVGETTREKNLNTQRLKKLDSDAAKTERL